MDTAGKAWIACYNAGKVVRMDLETGEFPLRPLLQVNHQVLCAF